MNNYSFSLMIIFVNFFSVGIFIDTKIMWYCRLKKQIKLNNLIIFIIL